MYRNVTYSAQTVGTSTTNEQIIYITIPGTISTSWGNNYNIEQVNPYTYTVAPNTATTTSGGIIFNRTPLPQNRDLSEMAIDENYRCLCSELEITHHEHPEFRIGVGTFDYEPFIYAIEEIPVKLNLRSSILFGKHIDKINNFKVTKYSIHGGFTVEGYSCKGILSKRTETPMSETELFRLKIITEKILPSDTVLRRC